MEIPTYCFSNPQVILWLNHGFSILLIRRKALFFHLWSEDEHILNTLPVCYLSDKTKMEMNTWWKNRTLASFSLPAEEIKECRETLIKSFRDPNFPSVNVKSVAIVL